MSRPIHPFGDGRDDADAEAGDGGRDSRGRFTRGNAGGPGNPHGRRTAQLRAALLGAIEPADLAAIGQSLLSAALAGDVAAAKLLLAYTIGQPGEAPADDTPEPGIRIVFETKHFDGSLLDSSFPNRQNARLPATAQDSSRQGTAQDGPDILERSESSACIVASTKSKSGTVRTDR